MWEVIVSHTFYSLAFQKKFETARQQIHSRNLTKFKSGFAPTETNVNTLFKDKRISLMSGKMESKYNLL